ncbi:MAG: hypothetical protein R3321_09210, partial [Nitrososphaeraceae archaeon]|nr:hypothetical protein [Nitrososphaeraceae archaeon]
NPLEVVDPRQLIISIDGVIQEPNSAFNVLSTNIVFTEAPAEGSTFWGILLGGTYDMLARELQNIILLNGKYDNTFGPQDSGAILTANTTSYTDSSTKVATTNFVRNRTLPFFVYNLVSSQTVNINTTITIPFVNGSLASSQVITGQSWTSNELTIPSSYYGLWDLRLKVISGISGADFNTMILPTIEVWTGAAWVGGNINEITTGTLFNTQRMTARTTRRVLFSASIPKIRCRLYQYNNSFNMNFSQFELSGYMLGGNT